MTKDKKPGSGGLLSRIMARADGSLVFKGPVVSGVVLQRRAEREADARMRRSNPSVVGYVLNHEPGGYKTPPTPVVRGFDTDLLQEESDYRTRSFGMESVSGKFDATEAPECVRDGYLRLSMSLPLLGAGNWTRKVTHVFSRYTGTEVLSPDGEDLFTNVRYFWQANLDVPSEFPVSHGGRGGGQVRVQIMYRPGQHWHLSVEDTMWSKDPFEAQHTLNGRETLKEGREHSAVARAECYSRIEALVDRLIEERGYLSPVEAE